MPRQSRIEFQLSHIQLQSNARGGLGWMSTGKWKMNMHLLCCRPQSTAPQRQPLLVSCVGCLLLLWIFGRIPNSYVTCIGFHALFSGQMWVVWSDRWPSWSSRATASAITIISMWKFNVQIRMILLEVLSWLNTDYRRIAPGNIKQGIEIAFKFVRWILDLSITK